jgi:hypothetical protein
MIDTQSNIDSKTEDVLKFVLDKFKNFDKFIDFFKNDYMKEELLYDNILESSDNYEIIFKSLSVVVNKYFYNSYNIEIDKNLLIELNKFINNEYCFREKNIIHRHFLHEISDFTVINSQIDNVFLKFNNKDFTVLENYTFLIYNLFKIYPFFNGLALRLIGDIYLLKNDYLPLVLSTRFKSEYYYMFQYDFDRFKNSFLELMLTNLNLFTENLGINK